jgi:KDO2-lipid IV(A) lauroyltransferase
MGRTRLGTGRPTARLPAVRAVADAVVYVGFRAAWALLHLVPLGVLRRGLEAAGHMAWLVDRKHREVVAANLRTAFPEWSYAARTNVERKAFANWGRIAAELVHFERSAAKRGRGDPTIRALAAASDPLLAGGRGLLVLTAHTGNFEFLARLWGRATGVEIAVFHRVMRNRRIDDFVRRERSACSFRVLGRGVTVREALRILARGGVFVVPLDQNQLPGRGIFVDLFGRPACTTTLLARLALASGATVLPVFAVWKNGDTVAEIGAPIETPSDAGGREKGTVVRALTERYTREIERVVRAHPSQWNWAHRRWKTRPGTEGAKQAEIVGTEPCAATDTWRRA